MTTTAAGLFGPEVYTDGLGELIRAHRLYLCLSKDEMARRLDMAVRTYERIESGRRDCPPGLLDSIRALVDEFEAAVDAVAAAAPSEVAVDVSNEWHRTIAGRAAVETGGAILPVLT